MAAKGQRIQVILECQSCKTSEKPGVSRCVTTKNKRTTSARIELKKYCKYERKHTDFKEIR